MEKPIFTITTSETNKVYKIYLNGNVEGFDEDIHISNLVPSIISREQALVKYNLLIDMVKQQSNFIEKQGWEVENFYSSKEPKSIDDGVLQGKKLYSFNTVHKSSTTSDI